MVQASLLDSVLDQASGTKLKVEHKSIALTALGHSLPQHDQSKKRISPTKSERAAYEWVLKIAEQTGPVTIQGRWHNRFGHFNRLPVVAEGAGAVGGLRVNFARV